VRKTIKITAATLFLFCLAVTLSGCLASGRTPTLAPAPAIPWQIEVSSFEIKDTLNYVESVTQYNGSKIDVVHTQTPDAGYVFLIMDVTISKNDNQSTASFDWQWLLVKDASGNTYHRLENDTFLEQYQYTPRITGLELRFGENTGWMAYEIPASAAAGKLTLAYTAQESQQELVLQK
jgi:hypothetical protein